MPVPAWRARTAAAFKAQKVLAPLTRRMRGVVIARPED
jgi:hypothetical protein